jgi:hypothetical protein
MAVGLRVEPTSARGARMPSSGSVVISSTVSGSRLSRLV